MGRVEPLSIHDRVGLMRLRQAMMSSSISSVHYWVLAPAPRFVELDPDPMPEVDSVEIQFESGTVALIRWAMTGTDEGLALEFDPDPLAVFSLAVVDAGGTSRWAALLGQPITEVRAA